MKKFFSKILLASSLVFALCSLQGFAYAQSCKSIFSNFKIQAKDITGTQNMILNEPSASAELKSFISSKVFEKMAMSEETAVIVDYLVQQNLGTYVQKSGDWIQELAHRAPGRTRMPFMKLHLGEVQGGIQIIDHHMYVLLKGIGVFPAGKNTLADGEVPQSPSRFFIKTITATFIAAHLLHQANPHIKHLTISTLASINGNIGSVLGDKLGLSARPTIPKDERTANIDDFQAALSQGADPKNLSIMSPQDFYIELNF